MSKLTKMLRDYQKRREGLEQMPAKLGELGARLAGLETRLESLVKIEERCAAFSAELRKQALKQAGEAQSAAEKQAHFRQWAERELYGIKQTANMSAAARPAGKKIKVIFLIHHIEAWDSIGDIYEIMRDCADFEPIAISIKRRFPGDKGFGFEEIIHQKLEEMGILHLRFSMENSFEGLDIILKALAPDIIFKQSQWDADVPPAFASNELRFAKLCYVPYSVAHIINIESLGAPNNPETDSPLHRAAWKLFYATEDLKNYFAATSVRQGDNLEITGHPKVRRLQRLGAGKPVWPIEQKGARRFRIIWSPHHSIDKNWLRFGMFPAVYRQMLDWVKNDNSIEMTLSFHPAALARIMEGKDGVSREQCEAFLNDWDSLLNTARWEAGNYAGLLQASDCMITDGISFLTEYQFFTKPIIFLERADHLPLSEAGRRIMRGVHPVADMAQARDLAHKFAAGYVDECAQAQRENTAWLAGDRLAGGSAAERIIASIRRGIRE